MARFNFVNTVAATVVEQGVRLMLMLLTRRPITFLCKTLRTYQHSVRRLIRHFTDVNRVRPFHSLTGCASIVLQSKNSFHPPSELPRHLRMCKIL